MARKRKSLKVAPADEPEVERAKRRGGPGAPSQYRPEYAEQAKKLYTTFGATDAEVASFLGFNINTLKNWVAAHPDFAAARALGKDEADDRVERSLYNRAVGYTYDSVKIFKCKDEEPTIVPYQEHVPPDTTACIFWLKNRRRDEWRDVQRHEVGKPGDFERMADDELAAELRKEAESLGLAPPEMMQ